MEHWKIKSKLIQQAPLFSFRYKYKSIDSASQNSNKPMSISPHVKKLKNPVCDVGFQVEVESKIKNYFDSAL